MIQVLVHLNKKNAVQILEYFETVKIMRKQKYLLFNSYRNLQLINLHSNSITLYQHTVQWF